MDVVLRACAGNWPCVDYSLGAQPWDNRRAYLPLSHAFSFWRPALGVRVSVLLVVCHLISHKCVVGNE
jgi:hypothetical protein